MGIGKVYLLIKTFDVQIESHYNMQNDMKLINWQIDNLYIKMRKSDYQNP